MHESGPVDHQRGDLSRDDGSRPAVTVLTPRQLQVMRLKATGMKDTAIAVALSVTATTVKRDRRHAREALGATCNEEVYADLGWLRVPNG